jgi:hypothetical protein
MAFLLQLHLDHSLLSIAGTTETSTTLAYQDMLDMMQSSIDWCESDDNATRLAPRVKLFTYLGRHSILSMLYSLSPDYDRL